MSSARPEPDNAPDRNLAAQFGGDAMARLFASALESDDGETAGLHLGPYKLLQEIGEGGFGTVWMAEQTEPIKRRVALKIIKRGMDTKEVIARFEVERQALALMDHPCIARVLDAGATSSGRPFFVMELVRGIPITTYCDENNVTTAARLRLFIQICQAVQHAHQKGIIHRDLKPSNILITVNDGEPVPKIIDFGIAKATGARLTDKTLFTQFHAFIGTPAYTSPEQMEMSSLDVDTRSDIYSLGVLLYELLTGRPPFDPDLLAKSGLDAMRRTIRETDPPRPSQRLATLPEADRTSVALRRGTESAELSLQLRGDLDWVVMRCLEKNRTRRYETVNGLALDVSRYLNNETVSARPPSGAYRLQKFIRRHKVGVGAATAISLSIVGALIVSAILLVRERRAHERARISEQKEVVLRAQADAATKAESYRESQTALQLAGQLMQRDQVGDALAYLVQAARKDPGNYTIAPRIISLLASNNFSRPWGPTLHLGSRIIALRYSDDSAHFYVGTEDGRFRIYNALLGIVEKEYTFNKRVLPDSWIFPRNNEHIFAARFEDNSFGVYSALTGEPLFPPILLDARVPPPTQGFASTPPVAFSPDGSHIFAHGSDGYWLWDARTGKNLIFREKQGIVASCGMAADNTCVAILTGEPVYNCEIWTLDGRQLQIFSRVNNAWFFPEGHHLVMAEQVGSNSHRSGALRVYDPLVGNPVPETIPLDAVPLTFRSSDILPDGELLYSIAGETLLYNFHTGVRHPIPVMNRSQEYGIFSKDGSTLITVSPTDFVQVTDIASGISRTVATIQPPTDFHAAVSSTGSDFLIGTPQGELQQYHIGGGPALGLKFPYYQHGTRFSPNQPHELITLKSDGVAAVDVVAGRETDRARSLPSKEYSGRRFLSSHLSTDCHYLVVHWEDGEMESWDLRESEKIKVVKIGVATKNYSTVFFSAVGDLAAITEVGARETRVWHLDTGEPAGPPIAVNGALIFESPNFNPGATEIALATFDGLAMTVDIRTGQPTNILRNPKGATNRAVTFSPNGRHIFTGSVWKEGRFWEPRSGAAQGPVFALPDGGDAGWAIFSPNSRYVASGGYRSVSVWDADTSRMVGRPLPVPIGNSNPPAIFSPDSQRLVTCEAPRRIRLQFWDVASSQPVTDPLTISGEALGNGGGFSPDGKFFAQGSQSESSVVVIPVPPQLKVGESNPEWLFKLALALGQKSIDASAQPVNIVDVASLLDEAKSELATKPANDVFAEWGRWILNDRADRSIAPGFTITPAEAKKLADSEP